jgi:pimeloyl-ACP methyl ester carboxylesterase
VTGQRFVVLVVAITAVCVGANSVAQVKTAPPLGALVDIGPRRMHLHCVGSGSPTVVLESGASSFALDWALVQPTVARTTRVCSYDRGGYGWSDPTPSGEAPEQVVRDLRLLLDAARERPPLVLVGASLGGIYARMFVLRHPTDVVGMVFVDPGHENRLWVVVEGKTIPVWARSVDDIRASLAPRSAWDAILARIPSRSPQTGAPFDRLPPELYEARIEFDQRLIASRSVVTYDQYVETEIGRQAAFVELHDHTTTTTRTLGDRPVVVLTRGVDSSQDLVDVHAALAAQSTNARHTVVAGAGHEIHLFAPEAAVQAIQDVVEAVRHGSKLPPR